MICSNRCYVFAGSRKQVTTSCIANECRIHEKIKNDLYISVAVLQNSSMSLLTQKLLKLHDSLRESGDFVGNNACDSANVKHFLSHSFFYSAFRSAAALLEIIAFSVIFSHSSGPLSLSFLFCRCLMKAPWCWS